MLQNKENMVEFVHIIGRPVVVVVPVGNCVVPLEYCGVIKKDPSGDRRWDQSAFVFLRVFDKTPLSQVF